MTNPKKSNIKKVDTKSELVNMEILGITNMPIQGTHGISYETILLGKYKDEYYILRVNKCTNASEDPLFLDWPEAYDDPF